MSTDTEWKQNDSLQAATLPTQYELPCEDDENLETERHKLQMDLLIYPLRAWLSQRQPDSYVGGNMFVYFSMAQVRGEDFRGPDVFVVLDVPPGERRWEGVHVNVRTTWLRWALADGTLLPTPEEAQVQEQQRAEAEKQHAETEKQRAEAAEAEVARLRALLADRDAPSGG